ncbi:MAG: hydrogenase maturation nickel metallochaperone HypA [Candidatus Acidiferrales bacterium]
MGIANSVLESVRTEARRFPGRHIAKVGVRIGELAGVDPDAMRFCFEALVQGTELEPLALDVDYRPRRHECLGCGEFFSPGLEDPACPRCRGIDSRFLEGDELELAYLEVEDGTCPAGT